MRRKIKKWSDNNMQQHEVRSTDLAEVASVNTLAVLAG